MEIDKNAFSGCINLISNAEDTPNLSGVTNMSGMFSDATNFNRPIGNWDVSSVFSLGLMFNGAGLSTNNYDATLIGWSQLSGLRSRVQFDGGNSTYSSAAVGARNTLTTAPISWNITDGGLVPLSICNPTKCFI